MRIFCIALLGAFVALAYGAHIHSETAVSTEAVKPKTAIASGPCCEGVRQTLLEIRKDIRLWLLDRLFGKLIVEHDKRANCSNNRITSTEDESVQQNTIQFDSILNDIRRTIPHNHRNAQRSDGTSTTSIDPVVKVVSGDTATGNTQSASSTTTTMTTSKKTADPVVKVISGNSQSGSSTTTTTISKKSDEPVLEVISGNSQSGSSSTTTTTTTTGSIAEPTMKVIPGNSQSGSSTTTTTSKKTAEPTVKVISGNSRTGSSSTTTTTTTITKKTGSTAEPAVKVITGNSQSGSSTTTTTSSTVQRSSSVDPVVSVILGKTSSSNNQSGSSTTTTSTSKNTSSSAEPVVTAISGQANEENSQSGSIRSETEILESSSTNTQNDGISGIDLSSNNDSYKPILPGVIGKVIKRGRDVSEWERAHIKGGKFAMNKKMTHGYINGGTGRYGVGHYPYWWGTQGRWMGARPAWDYYGSGWGANVWNGQYVH